MKAFLTASVVVLLGTIPAFAQTPGQKIVCMIEMFPNETAESEVALQHNQLVTCANEYRAMRSVSVTNAGGGSDAAASPAIGTARPTHFMGIMCPADATDIAGGQGHGTDCIPGGRN